MYIHSNSTDIAELALKYTLVYQIRVWPSIQRWKAWYEKCWLLLNSGVPAVSVSAELICMFKFLRIIY